MRAGQGGARGGGEAKGDGLPARGRQVDQTRGYSVMGKKVIIGLSLLLAGCFEAPPVEGPRQGWWSAGRTIFPGAPPAEGRTIAKVCKDGTRVYQRANGSYYIGGLGGADVAGPEVCQ